ncbi:MAG: alpha-amylase family glycosyl hydrolase [Candidatus Gastranaerophilales bacterium]|nr:alpha-amylase family glycosyl hydrolase [Candidatus Gastranaerophilales bacterium]
MEVGRIIVMDKFSNSIKYNQNLSFKGHKLVTNDEGKKEYQFYLPTNDTNIQLEAVIVDKNGNKKATLTPVESPNSTIPIWSIPVSEVKLNDNDRLAYKFLNSNGSVLDETIKIKTPQGDYNLATKGTRPALEKSRSIYHLVPDSFNPSKKAENGQEIRRNHFNKYDGKLTDITEKLDYIQELGAKRIMGTPIFGQDRLTNHGYWTTNPYQITGTLGDLNDYRDMQVKLFQKGMGWIADGAFVNEGVEGVHIKHIMEHGKKSPFKDWFNLQDFESKGLKFGLLPKELTKDAKDNFDIKLINSPYLYKFNQDGSPHKDFGKINPSYDFSKPTYIQLFDVRLVDENQRNSDEIIQTYAKSKFNDYNQIKTYKDSVQPILAKVSSTEVKEKFNDFGKRNLLGFKQNNEVKHLSNEPQVSKFRDLMLEWNNFSLDNSDRDGTIQLWDGNKDIAKLQFKNPQVQDYVTKIGAYWTDETDRVLTKYVASVISSKTNGKNSEQNVLNAVKTLSEDGMLQKDTHKNLEASIKNLYEGKYEVNLAPVENTLNDSLRKFPLDSVEFPPEICSVLSLPSIKGLEGKKDLVIADKMDNICKNQLTPIIGEIIQTSEKSNLINDNDELTKEGKDLFRLVSNDVMRYVALYAIGGISPDVEIENGITYIDFDKEKLADSTFTNVNINGDSKEVASNLLNAYSKGIIRLSKDDTAKKEIIEIINNGLNGIDHKLLKVSKLIIDKNEAGLEWRIDAAKDVADIDATRNHKETFENNWEEVINFWSKFNTEVRKYNPKAYTIGEVTDVPQFMNFNKSVKEEQNFIEKTGFTTQSNYSYLFSMPPALVHGFPDGEGKHLNIGNLNKELEAFLKSGPVDNIMQSHFFSGNHDKLRTNHGFAVDVAKFVNGPTLKSDFPQEEAREAVKNSPIFNIINEGFMSSNQDWWKSFNDTQKYDKIIDNFTKDGNWMKNDDRIISSLSKEKSGSYSIEYKKVSASIEKLIKENPAPATEAGAIYDAFNDILDDKNSKFQTIPENAQITIKSALKDLATGKMTTADEKKISGTDISDHFAKNAYNHTFSDVIEQARRKNPAAMANVNTKALEKEVHEKLMEPAFEKYKALYSILVALPGNPTIYSGDELGETGFETPSKNVYVHNRNRNHWEWIDKNSDEYSKKFEEFNNSVKNIFSLRDKKELSPLKNGTTIRLDFNSTQNLGAIYRYNTKRDVISVINTSGFSNTRGGKSVNTIYTDGISLDKIPGGIINDTHTVFRAIKSGDTKPTEDIYEIKNNKLVKKSGEQIEIDSSVIHFYRVGEFPKPSINQAFKANYM